MQIVRPRTLLMKIGKCWSIKSYFTMRPIIALLKSTISKVIPNYSYYLRKFEWPLNYHFLFKLVTMFTIHIVYFLF